MNTGSPFESNTAVLVTSEGPFRIQERRSVVREKRADGEAAKRSYNASDQMTALGGLIILGVLASSYTTKYDLAIGHARGHVAMPALGYLALQIFLARAAYRLFHDMQDYETLGCYLRQRILRYLPAVIPAVFLGFLLIRFGHVPHFQAGAGSLPANLAMVADMVGVEEIDSSHWRLKLEVVLSLLTGLAWFSRARRHLAAILLGGLLVTAIYLDGEPVRQHTLTFHGLLTADGYLPLFAFGIALFQLTSNSRSWIWWLVGAASLVLAFLSNEPLHGAVVVAALAVLAAIVTGHFQALGRVRCLVLLGDLAFPIYVVHFVAGFAVIHGMEAAGAPAVVSIAAAIMLAIGLGTAVNVLFERPVQRNGRRLMSVLQRSVCSGLAAGIMDKAENPASDGAVEHAPA